MRRGDCADSDTLGRTIGGFTCSQFRYLLHITYASPIQRGEVRVIEDLPLLSNVPVRLRLEETIRRIYLAPQKTEIPFHQTAGLVEFTIPAIHCHQI